MKIRSVTLREVANRQTERYLTALIGEEARWPEADLGMFSSSAKGGPQKGPPQEYRQIFAT